MAKPAIIIGDGKFATKDTKFLAYAQGESSNRFVARELTYDRGSNLTATRVASNGLVEKGREQLLLNTTFSGAVSNTSVSGFTVSGSGGTFGVANASGQLTFTASDETKRRYLVSPTQSTTSCLYTQSVFVDAVEGTVELDEIMRSNSSANTTLIHNLEDGVVVGGSTVIQAGKRYSRTYTLDSSTTTFRFGIGANPLSNAGAASVTLSKPQLEKGVTPTDYIENTSTSATLKASILEDQARVDYLSNSNGYLLLEPTRQNKFAHSEYMAGTFSNIRSTFSANAGASPEGVQNATAIFETATGSTHGFQKLDIDIDLGTFYSISFFVKANGREKFFVQCNDDTVLAMNVTVDLSGTPSAVDNKSGHTGTEEIINYGNGWYRVEINGKEGLKNDSDQNINFFFIEDASGTTTSYTGDASKGLLFYGLQLEEGKFCSSYIPTYGIAATRSAEGLPSSTSSVDMSSFMEGDDVTLVVHFVDNPSVSRDNSSAGIELNNGGASTGKVAVYRNNDAARQLHIVFFGTDGNNVGIPITSSAPKIAIRRVRSSNAFTVYMDGAPLDDSGSATDSNGDFTNSNFDVTWDDLKLSGINSTIKILSLKLFDSALTNSEMASETS